ncbi:MAG: YafY family protein [Paenibacillus macerans]|uniref:DeoR-like helix-turn-helix domain protein n=1 Tax=Paenibacillus macerans TaxID=44252 RepID=A0A090ZD16_PAEMA|nr:YafY family protein [Paenibacillus macerans]KFN08328.1 deoR-like helix-turn-helix domain protein [Paenibacillus macerans]MBS5914644.1 YafY family transcriptional regulator [Paenibacillus macerans]MCY7559514.1 YafY family transcriptional regulator [Paenibacillus macerans]MDU7473567.1 YafY family protein [Paenibacillus macerans]MEC0136199.1 YafY family protein [Paenibacillus macerans]
MKLDRLLSITMALLGSRKRLTAEDLAERFEVSLRTVYRDIETLSQAGIPIISYPGPDGGYEIMPSYRLDKQMLTLEQLYSLYSAVRGIQTATDNPDLTGLLEKIGALLPEHSAPPTAARLDFQHASKPDEREKIRSLDLAVRELRVAEFDYMDFRGEETTRTVEPMGLYLMRGAWYLWGFCRFRSALRVFRLSRMNHLKVLSEKFDRRHLTIEDVDKGRQKPPGGVEALLQFQPSAKTKVRDEFDHGRIILNADGTLHVSAYYYTVEQAVQHIIRFGVQAKVLGPPELIQAFRSHVLKIAGLYP